MTHAVGCVVRLIRVRQVMEFTVFNFERGTSEKSGSLNSDWLLFSMTANKLR